MRLVRISRLLLFGSIVLFFIMLYFLHLLQTEPESSAMKSFGELEKRIKNLEVLIKQSQEKRDRLLSNLSVRNMPYASSPPTCLNSTKTSAGGINMIDVFEKLSFDNPDGGKWKQGWPVTYNTSSFSFSNKLKVFVVPHSHNDPGWIKTLDRYFTDQTRNILDNVVNSLLNKPSRKFIWAEISYFSMWWDIQSQSRRNEVARLIETGQLEIVTGGWVMPDEASSHYYAIIDQLLEGRQWLHRHIPTAPNPVSGWSIDPFGHSPTMPFILKLFGIKHTLIQRIHYSVKKHLAKAHNLEFLWRQNWDAKSATDLFTHMMPFFSYDVPHTCGPEPAICCQFDFARIQPSSYRCPWQINPVEITASNVHEQSLKLVDQYKKKAQLYRTNVVLAPLGDDFRYDKPKECKQQFENYERIFEYVNSHPELHTTIQFGSLSDYFNEIDDKLKPEVLSGDFYTYADKDDHYWSGYFTSRPFTKAFERSVSHVLRASEILFTWANMFHSLNENDRLSMIQKLAYARQALGLFQHHDGITGTAKDAVVVDYSNRLLKATNYSLEMAATLITKMYHLRNPITPLETRSSISKPLTMQVLKLTHPKQVILYNPLGWGTKRSVRIVTSSPEVKILDVNGAIVSCQANLVFSPTDGSLRSHEYEIVWIAHLLPLTVTSYTIEPDTSAASCVLSSLEVMYGTPPSVEGYPFKVSTVTPREFSISTSSMNLSFSNSAFLLKANDFIKKKSFQISNSFRSFGVRTTKQKSGAYLFLPDGDSKLKATIPSYSRTIRGPLHSSVTVGVGTPYNSVQQKLEIIECDCVEATIVQVDNLVDLSQSGGNEEVVVAFNTPGITSDVIYTDLNGFQMQRRQWHDKLPLHAQVYPMTSMYWAENDQYRFTVHSAQSQGVLSSKRGRVELFLDRRLNQDDGRGLQQPVRDNKLTHSRMWLTFETDFIPITQKSYSAFPTSTSSQVNLLLNHPPIAFSSNQVEAVRPLPLLPFPCNVHLVNYRTTQGLVGVENEAILIFHYLGSDCSKQPHSYIDCPQTDTFTLSQLLPSQSLVTSHSLNGLSSNVISPDRKIKINPMYIEDFKVTFS